MTIGTEMINYYLIENDGYGFKWLALQVDDFIDLMPEAYSDSQLLRFSYHNTSLADGWEGVRSRFVQSDDAPQLPIPDVSLWLSGAALVISSKAYEVLSELIAGFGELLPVTSDEGTFYIFNCRTSVDADPTQSEHIIESGQVIGVKRLGFNSKDVGDTVIFKTSFNNCTDLFCSNAFKQAVEAHGLTGVKFSENLLPTLND